MKKSLFTALLCLCCASVMALEDTFKMYTTDSANISFEQMWEGYDPTKEPLDVEVLKEWEQDGVKLQIIRYCALVHKGQKSMVAAVYGYPIGGKNLPALVQTHGGGQSASADAVIANAKRGYATISVAWAGRIIAEGYTVDKDIRALFDENKTDDPKYLLTTDWAAVDGFHAPSRYPDTQVTSEKPSKYSIDTVPSPRNNSFFLGIVAGRRAITFLQAQKEVVNPEKIGMYGHSMGGRLTTYVSGSDARIVAAAPSCGGLVENEDPELDNRHPPLAMRNKYFLANSSAKFLFLAPVNDFYGQSIYIQESVACLKNDYRVASTPHYSHRDIPSGYITGLLWMDMHLKGTFTYPKEPATELKLGATPTYTVTPDESMRINSVEVYYSFGADIPDNPENRDIRKYRFWNYAPTVKKGDKYVAELPLQSTDKVIWVYAHVNYDLGHTESGADFGYKPYSTDNFNVSSVIEEIFPEQLKKAGAKVTFEQTDIIEDFQGEWAKQWYSHSNNGELHLRTNKIFRSAYSAPEGATKIILTATSEKENTLVVQIDESYSASVKLKAGTQTVELALSEFKNKEKEELSSFSETGKITLIGRSGADNIPEFKLLKWAK